MNHLGSNRSLELIGLILLVSLMTSDNPGGAAIIFVGLVLEGKKWERNALVESIVEGYRRGSKLMPDFPTVDKSKSAEQFSTFLLPVLFIGYEMHLVR